MARAGDLGDGRPWPLAAEPLGRLGGEDRALGPADEERRRPHAPHVLPERLELEVDRAEDRRVELVGPAPVGSLAEGMSQSLADVLDRPAGVERLRGSHRVLEGIEVASRELARDRVAPPALHRRGDVDHHEPTHGVGMRRGERDRVQPAHAERDERRSRPPSVGEKAADVVYEIRTAIHPARRPVGVPVAALVERQHVMVGGEVGSDVVPAVRGLRAAVEQQQRGPGRRSPVEEVEAETAEHRGAVARRSHRPSLARSGGSV